MLLFSRAVTLAGSPRFTMPWVGQITEHVNANSSLEVSAWNADFGHPIGTVVWNALIESQKELGDATAGLLSNAGYLDLVEAGQQHATVPGQDALRLLLHGSPSTPPALGSVATVTTATVVVDRVADATVWAVDVAQHVESVIGSPVSLWSSVYGQMGELVWINIGDDAAAVDATSAQLGSDQGYLYRLHASRDLFIPGSGHVARFSRVA